MIGALWTGISGLSSQQKALDNESNNIANVNTVGYKSSRISFADQMYQSKIGKGSVVQDAEKLFVQGNTKITGVEYDMMLEGDGFFTVINKNSLGTAESFYTRAGNFRMGDNGTLQDAGGNEVQGWIMSQIDAQKDVTSTNPNSSVFTNDYNKMLGSKIIKHGTYVETITAKATDYNTTAKGDSTTVFSGDGAKSKSSKVSDIEEAIKDYNSWLQKLQENPSAINTAPKSQVSQVDFASGKNSIISKDGDAVYVVVNGDKISQKFITTNSTAEFRQDLWNSLTKDEREEENLVDPSGELTPAQIASYDKAAGKIATYKALADLISNKYPVEATTAIDKNKEGIFDINQTFDNSTRNADVLKGIIQIKSLIPGQEFRINEAGEEGSGSLVVQANVQTSVLASKGSGSAAVEASRDALSRLLTGKEQDVYSNKDLGLGDGIPKYYNYSIVIYDKETGENITIPEKPVAITASNIEDFIKTINEDQELNQHVVARNVNGNLVVQTLDSNYDVEFSSNLEELPSIGVSLNNIVDNSEYNFEIMVNGNPVNFGFDFKGEDTLSANKVYTKLRDAIANYNQTAPEDSKIKLTEFNADTGKFAIYSENKNTSFENSKIIIDDVVNLPMFYPPFYSPYPSPNDSAVSTIMAEGNLKIEKDTATNEFPNYTLSILGETINVPTNTNDTVQTVYNKLKAEIENNDALSNLISLGDLIGDTFKITQNKLNPNTAPVSMTEISGTGYTSTKTAYADSLDGPIGKSDKWIFSPEIGDDKATSVYTLEIDGTKVQIMTDQTPTVQEIADALTLEISKNDRLSEMIDLEVIDIYQWDYVNDDWVYDGSGNKEPVLDANGDPVKGIRIGELLTENGFQGLPGTPMITISSLTDPDDKFKSLEFGINETTARETNKNFSGRKGAGAEFLEIKTTVDQTASKGSIQLRLDTLNISDSPFGEFSVDSTGLITMKQDGAEYAVGQVAIARFNNNRGLEPQGNNLFAKTSESGDPIYNINNNKMADVRGKALELSNADLSESLVNLMIFQRAFEANAKSITTSDELLNTLINLKR